MVWVLALEVALERLLSDKDQTTIKTSANKMYALKQDSRGEIKGDSDEDLVQNAKILSTNTLHIFVCEPVGIQLDQRTVPLQILLLFGSKTFTH